MHFKILTHGPEICVLSHSVLSRYYKIFGILNSKTRSLHITKEHVELIYVVYVKLLSLHSAQCQFSFVYGRNLPLRTHIVVM